MFCRLCAVHLKSTWDAFGSTVNLWKALEHFPCTRFAEMFLDWIGLVKESRD